MATYGLIEYSDNYSETFGSLWQNHKEAPNGNITNSSSFKLEAELTGKTPNNDNTKNAKMVASLK